MEKPGGKKSGGIYYRINRIAGKKPERFIAYLHGLGEDHSIFNRQIEHFEKRGYSTLAPDLRAQGRSSLLPLEKAEREITIPALARDLEAIVQKEGIGKTVLAGFSLGGTVALEYARNFPGLVDKLILINPVLYADQFLKGKVKLVRHILELAKPFSRLDSSPRENFPDLSKAVFSNAYYSFLNGLRVTPLFGLYRNIGALTEYGVPEYLPPIKSPALILSADGDEFLKPALAAFIYYLLLSGFSGSSNAPECRWEILKGNHLLMLSNPGAVNLAIEKFLEGKLEQSLE